MGRILAVDYGQRRCGLAATDPLRLSVNVLGTYAPDQLLDHLRGYLHDEEVDTLVLTRSTHADGTDNAVQERIDAFATRLRVAFPALELFFQDEFGTSREAAAHLRAQGVGKKRRQEKGRLDGIAAALILERYLRDAGIW